MIHVSHNDLDGYGCTAITRKVHPKVKTRNVAYGGFEGAIEAALAKDEPIIVSDIWFNRTGPLLDALRQRDVTVYDHHETALPLQEGFSGVRNPRFCATKIISEALGYSAPWIDFVNEWDLSGNVETAGGDLNALFNFNGPRWFYDFTKRGHLSTEDLNTLQTIQKERRRAWRNLRHEVINGWAYARAFDKDGAHTAYLLHELRKVTGRCILVNEQWRSTSIRSGNGEAKVLAERLGGGGHGNAAGVSRIVERWEISR